MWYINGRVESIVLRRKAGDFFHNEDKFHTPKEDTRYVSDNRRRQESLCSTDLCFTGLDGMPGETGFEEKYCLNISTTYCFAITYQL